jgi:hypothetical protein
MDKEAQKLFLAIGSCHHDLKLHAKRIEAHPDVRRVTHWLDMHNFDDTFRMEEYVDAELLCGQAISWALELTLTGVDFTVEADVRRVDEKGQDLIVQIAERRYATTLECVNGLLDATRRLCSIDPFRAPCA